MKKLYELEVQRRNITPKAFFNACDKAMKKKGASMDDWTTYEDWADESRTPHRNENEHEDWDDPRREICSMGPYKMQLFLARSYNFILEFDFDTNETGSGYLYLVEFER